MMRKLFALCVGLAVSAAITCGGEEGEVSLERVKANLVRVLMDTNAQRLKGLIPLAASSRSRSRMA